jgi:murein DD-endopeptidase MepM/ murein hydrolase activator NlpD
MRPSISSQRRRLRAFTSIALALLGMSIAAHAARAQNRTVTAPPASVVRWIGGGTSECRFAGATFAPREDTCFLAIDLLAEGTLEALRVRAGREERLRVVVGDYPYEVQRLTIRDQGYVELSAADAARADRESARIAKLWSRGGPVLDAPPLSAPLERLPAGGRFGAKRILNGEPRSPHTGADYVAAQGTPVLAPADGIVALAEEHFFAGNSIFLDHGDGLISMVFHLHEIFVVPGQRVTRGAVIGTVGSTGRSTGAHLHFGLRWHGARIDPRPLLGKVEALVAAE